MTRNFKNLLDIFPLTIFLLFKSYDFAQFLRNIQQFYGVRPICVKSFYTHLCYIGKKKWQPKRPTLLLFIGKEK